MAAGPIGRSVGRKLALAVSGILSVLSVAFVAFLLVLSHREMEDLNGSWLNLLTETVAGSVGTVMEQGHGPAFKNVVKDVTGRKEIEAIRVVALDGKIRFSANE